MHSPRWQVFTNPYLCSSVYLLFSDFMIFSLSFHKLVYKALRFYFLLLFVLLGYLAWILFVMLCISWIYSWYWHLLLFLKNSWVFALQLFLLLFCFLLSGIIIEHSFFQGHPSCTYKDYFLVSFPIEANPNDV